MSELKVAIAGAGGRMGGANLRATAHAEDAVVAAALERAGSPLIGLDAGEVAGLQPLGVIISDDMTALDTVDAVIDFTTPAATVTLAAETAKRGLVHIIGTTGCSAADEAAIAEAGRKGARIVMAGNFSLGINLLLGLVRQATAALPGFDIEVLEMHHNRKVDAPSGTALMLGQAAAEGRGIDLDSHAVKAREGHTGPREAGTIGFATLRGGNVIGDHKVILAGPSERLELGHVADERSLFADGALRAALWARHQPAGLYSMADVLGFTKKES